MPLASLKIRTTPEAVFTSLDSPFFRASPLSRVLASRIAGSSAPASGPPPVVPPPPAQPARLMNRSPAQITGTSQKRIVFIGVPLSHRVRIEATATPVPLPVDGLPNSP